jgi:hypothetical protein
MKKRPNFERLQDAKFRTSEGKELESVTGGMVADMSLDTVTVYSNGTSKNDGQDPGDTPYSDE